MCDLFDDLLSFRKRKDEKCQKKTTKKAILSDSLFVLTLCDLERHKVKFS